MKESVTVLKEAFLRKKQQHFNHNQYVFSVVFTLLKETLKMPLSRL